jgi:hypothetical protein
MADDNVSDFTTCTDPVADDILYLVDISEATAANRSKNITFGALMARIVVNDGAVVCNNGEVVIN